VHVSPQDPPGNMVTVWTDGCGNPEETLKIYPAIVSVGCGITANIKAEPAPGYEFVRWRGELLNSYQNTKNPALITMNTDKTVTAIFAYVGGGTEFSLTVDVNPEEGGQVKINGVSPGSYPFGNSYPVDTEVTLEAEAAPGYELDCWSWGPLGKSTNETVVIPITSNMEIFAHFTAVGGGTEFSLTVDVNPEKGGQVKINGVSPGSYPYTPDPYPLDAEVTLKADAAPGYEFDYWSGGTLGGSQDETVVIPMTCDKEVIAHFFYNGAEPEALLYFPHVASDVETGWETEICLISTSDDRETPLTGIFKAYDHSGIQISEDIPVALPARARNQFIVGDYFDNPEDIGYIVFETSSYEIVGYTKFYVEGKYRAAVPAVSEINEGDIYLSHIHSDNFWITGISLVNTTDSQIDLDIEFDNGESRTRPIAAGQHDVFLIRELFGGDTQPDIHSGVIKNGAGIIGLELFASGNRLSGILLTDETATSIYYPYVASNEDWYTRIVVCNSDEAECDLTITPYSTEGDVLTIPPIIPVSGNDNYTVDLSQLDLPDGTAWFQIDATNPITGFELFGPNDFSRMGGFSGVNISAKEGIFPKIEEGGYGEIAFVNIEDSSGTVTLTAYKDSGDVEATVEINLESFEKRSGRIDVNSWVTSKATYIAYSSDLDLVGFQFNSSADAMMLDGLPALEAW